MVRDSLFSVVLLLDFSLVWFTDLHQSSLGSLSVLWLHTKLLISIKHPESTLFTLFCKMISHLLIGTYSASQTRSFTWRWPAAGQWSTLMWSVHWGQLFSLTLIYYIRTPIFWNWGTKWSLKYCLNLWSKLVAVCSQVASKDMEPLLVQDLLLPLQFLAGPALRLNPVQLFGACAGLWVACRSFGRKKRHSTRSGTSTSTSLQRLTSAQASQGPVQEIQKNFSWRTMAGSVAKHYKWKLKLSKRVTLCSVPPPP